MPNIVVCSICSNTKSADAGLVPARQRYLGSHIATVDEEAKRRGVGLFILSGVYGLMSAEELIPLYDYLLMEYEIPALTRKLCEQLRSLEIEEIHFYTKSKLSWRPYKEALKRAADSLKILLHIHELSEND